MTPTELKQQVGKVTVPVVAGSPTISHDLASYSLHVTHGAAGEAWPANAKGAPMRPMAQIVFAEVAVVPSHLEDLQMVAIFVDPEAQDCGLRNGQGWLLRAYLKGQPLIPLSGGPPAGEEFPPHALKWGAPITDMPPSPDYVPRTYEEALVAFYETTKHADICSHAFKVGGYPRHLQWEIHFCETVPNEEEIKKFGTSLVDISLPNPAAPVFAFQVASMHELHLHLMDMGIFYFGRGSGKHTAEWFAQIESH